MAVAGRQLFDSLNDSGGWTLDVPLDELPVPDRSGRPFAIARVPSIERRFASPMHTTAGMPPRLGSWRDELAAFLGGQLPSARLRPRSSQNDERPALRTAVIRAIQEGFAGSVKVDAEGELYGYLARPERIAATIEIDALAADYQDWFSAAGVLDPELGVFGEEIAEQLDWAIEDLRERCYSDYLDALGDERYRAEYIRGAVVDGIIVGEDPAQACANLLYELTGDQRLWETTGSRGRFRRHSGRGVTDREWRRGSAPGG